MVNFYQKYTYSIIVINLTNFEYVFKTILFFQTFSINYIVGAKSFERNQIQKLFMTLFCIQKSDRFLLKSFGFFQNFLRNLNNQKINKNI